MTAQEKDRIECAIRHIQTAADVDPWACDIAVEAMQKQIPEKLKMPLDAYWVCPVCGSKVESISKAEQCKSNDMIDDGR